jgi:hypothetical protein
LWYLLRLMMEHMHAATTSLQCVVQVSQKDYTAGPRRLCRAYLHKQIHSLPPTPHACLRCACWPAALRC